MAGTITHEWNGTILTITSDSGTSSMDLKGGQGDIGPRGPQGPAGIITDGSGGGSVDLTGYATEEYVDNAIAEAQLGGGSGGDVDVDLSNYYTKSEVDAKIPNTSNYALKSEIPDTSNLATKQEVSQAVSGLATETFVTTKIAEAQLSGGEGGDVDLSGYRTLDNNEFYGVRVTDPEYGFINIWPNGIEGPDDKLWIDNQGNGYFSTLSIGTSTNNKPVATQEWVTTAINNAIAALDGSEVPY